MTYGWTHTIIITVLWSRHMLLHCSVPLGVGGALFPSCMSLHNLVLFRSMALLRHWPTSGALGYRACLYFVCIFLLYEDISGSFHARTMWQSVGGVRPDRGLGGHATANVHALAHVHSHKRTHTHTHTHSHPRTHRLRVYVFAQTALLGPSLYHPLFATYSD